MKKGLVSFSVEAILADDRKKYQERPPISGADQQRKGVEKVIKQERNDDPDSTVQDEEKMEADYPSVITVGTVSVSLLDHRLWEEFNSLATEMIITKAGRRMFPTLKVSVRGLREDVQYDVGLRMESVDCRRYRYVYQSSEWVVCGGGDTLDQASSLTHLHPSSPALGSFWNNQQLLSFDRIKLTNNRTPVCKHQVCLHSMHKYQPVIEISSREDQRFSASFSFPQTIFTTVTAYQNQQITKLKIASNPFAKGFRESTRPRDCSVWGLVGPGGVVPVLLPPLHPLLGLQLYHYNHYAGEKY